MQVTEYAPSRPIIQITHRIDHLHLENEYLNSYMGVTMNYRPYGPFVTFC